MRVRVVGSHYYLPSTIRQQLPALSAGQVPNLQEAQTELNEINRLPDRRVTPTLKPGQTPGTIDEAIALQQRLDPSNKSTDALQVLLMRMRDEGKVRFDIKTGRWSKASVSE